MQIEELVKKPLKSDKDIKRVDILLLTCGQPTIEKECINDLIDYTKYPYRLVILDNRPDSVLGEGTHLTKVWNKLLSYVTSDYVCMMNSDIYVGNDWLTQMMKVFQYPDVGVVVPILGMTSPNYIQTTAKKQEPYEVNEQVSGCCFLFKSELIKNVGLFNEEYYFYGLELEWFKRVINAGYKIYLQPDVTMRHGKSLTMKKMVNEEFLNSDTLYSRKLNATKNSKTTS